MSLAADRRPHALRTAPAPPGGRTPRELAPGDVGGEGHAFENQSVTRVGQILALFGPQATELTASEIAERLDLNRTTAYRYLASMVTAGILERGRRRGTFVVGGLMVQLGILALDRKRVLSMAPPYLRELSIQTSATAVLSVWGIASPVVAFVQEAPRQGALVTVRPGAQIGMSASQMHVFLAHHGDQELVQRILAGLPAGQRALVEQAVYDVRRNGYGVVRFPSGLFGAAAPVFDEYGMCAAIAVLGADQTVDLSERSPTVSALLRTATALGDVLDSRGGVHAQLR